MFCSSGSGPGLVLLKTFCKRENGALPQYKGQNKFAQVRDYLNSDGVWNFSAFHQDVQVVLSELLSDLGFNISDVDDKLVWMPSRDGAFSTKLAWESLRRRSTPSRVAKWLWRRPLPTFLSLI